MSATPCRHRQSLNYCAQLEARRLLAASIVGDDLTIEGTSGDDTINVTYSAAGGLVTVSINEQDSEFSGGLISRVVISGLAGHDTIRSKYSKTTVINGGRGNDTLAVGSQFAELFGGAGNDLILGGSGNNEIYGDRDDDESFTGDDTLRGFGGDDVFFSDNGDDVIDGGSQRNNGHDIAHFYRRGDDLTLSLDGVANDGSTGELGNLINMEGVVGGSGDDLILGNDKRNYLVGERGDDTVRGFAGDDELHGDAESNSNDSGDDSLTGDSGNDYIVSGLGNDTVSAGAGDDAVVSRGNATVTGGSGNDDLTIDGDDSRVFGESGSDRIYLFIHGDDPTTSRVINGGSGSDYLTFMTTDNIPDMRISLDSIANDGRRGTSDHDNVTFIETIFSSSGNDILDASAVGVSVELGGGHGKDTLIGGSGADRLIGSEGRDSLVGNGGNDKLFGEAGDDFLIGNGGADVLNAGDGDDTIKADDNIKDNILGSGGSNDEADVDDGLDQVSGVEILT